MTITRWTAEQAGCIFNGASSRTGDELSAAVVDLALLEGWSPQDRSELKHLASVTGWCDDLDDSNTLSYAAYEAADWLNEHIAPEGYMFVFDEGFYLWATEDADL